VRISNATIATRPTSLPPTMKAADQHLRRIDQVVMQLRNLTRLKPTGPMRFFQLAFKTRLVAADRSEREEAILEVPRQNGPVLQVLDRLSLGVQQVFRSLEDFCALGQEKLQKFDMRLKRHLAKTFAYHNAPSPWIAGRWCLNCI